MRESYFYEAFERWEGDVGKFYTASFAMPYKAPQLDVDYPIELVRSREADIAREVKSEIENGRAPNIDSQIMKQWQEYKKALEAYDAPQARRTRFVAVAEAPSLAPQ